MNLLKPAKQTKDRQCELVKPAEQTKDKRQRELVKPAEQTKEKTDSVNLLSQQNKRK